MEQNRKLYKKRIAIAGGGPAGVMAAVFASKNPDNEVYIFEKNEILKTLLPTGGGRCNLAFAEFDFKELAKYYPRGEKFLYSVFSKFATQETLNFFESVGVKTYTQDDFRIFPVTDSSQSVRKALINELKNVQIKKEYVADIESENGILNIKTEKNMYEFDALVISTGSKGIGHRLAQKLGHNIIPVKPALTSLKIKEKFLSELSGMSLKDIEAKIYFENKKEKFLKGDLLFTHYGISGPLAYKISSYFAYYDFNDKSPLLISINFTGATAEEFDKTFNEELKNNPKKDILNIMTNYIPKNLASSLLNEYKIDSKIKAGQLKKEDRIKISEVLTNFVINAISTAPGEEIVNAGGVDLNEIDPKTMSSKLIDNLCFCGEILDIDGLTGGFNLQNCWSTGYIAGSTLAR